MPNALVECVRAVAFRLMVTTTLVASGGIALAQECPAPTGAEAEAIGRAYFDAFNTGDRAALDGLLAADYSHQGAIVTPQDRGLHLDRLDAVRSGFPTASSPSTG